MPPDTANEIAVLSRYFRAPEMIDGLLDAVLTPKEFGRLPSKANMSSEAYWRLVCSDIRDGKFASCGQSLEPLMAKAADQLPGNEDLRPWRQPESEPANRHCRGVRIIARGGVPGTRLAEIARDHVKALGLRFMPELGIRYFGCVCLECVGDGSLEDGHRLAEAIETTLKTPGAVDVLDLTFRDYYHPLLLEVCGRVFTANSLPASTRVEAVEEAGWRASGYLPPNRALPRGSVQPPPIPTTEFVPAPVARYLIGQLAGTFTDGTELALRVRIGVAANGTASAALDAFPADAEVPVRVRLDASGFDYLTQPELLLTVPTHGDSLPVVFLLRPTSTNGQKLLVSALHHGKVLGRLSCLPSIVT